jgi:hypothetical protein
VQADGLVQGAQLMKAISALRADTQTKIDLCEGTDRNSHLRLIVNAREPCAT